MENQKRRMILDKNLIFKVFVENVFSKTTTNAAKIGDVVGIFFD